MKNFFLALVVIPFSLALSAQAEVVDVKLTCNSAPRERMATLNFPFEKSEWNLSYGASPIDGEIECRIQASQPVALTLDGVVYSSEQPEVFESFPATDAKAFCESAWQKSGPTIFDQAGIALTSDQGSQIHYLFRRVNAARFLPDATIELRPGVSCTMTAVKFHRL